MIFRLVELYPKKTWAYETELYYCHGKSSVKNITEIKGPL